MSCSRAVGWTTKPRGLCIAGRRLGPFSPRTAPATRKHFASSASPPSKPPHTPSRAASTATAPQDEPSSEKTGAPSSSSSSTPSPTTTQDKYFQDVHFLGDAAGTIAVRAPPTFASAAAARAHHKRHLAAAFRVLARQGLDEGVAGHISLRDPEHPGRFWINPLSMHFGQVRASDLVLVDEGGRVLRGGAQLPINGPAFAIHSEIHRARPDVNAACHAHSVYGKAFSTFGRVIEPLYQDAIRFYDDLSGEFVFSVPPPPSLPFIYTYHVVSRDNTRRSKISALLLQLTRPAPPPFSLRRLWRHRHLDRGGRAHRRGAGAQEPQRDPPQPRHHHLRADGGRGGLPLHRAGPVLPRAAAGQRGGGVPGLGEDVHRQGDGRDDAQEEREPQQDVARLPAVL